MLLDADILVDILRGYPPAVAWSSKLGAVELPGLVAMEVLQGCRSTKDQRRVQKKLRRFSLALADGAGLHAGISGLCRISLKEQSWLIGCADWTNGRWARDAVGYFQCQTFRRH